MSTGERVARDVYRFINELEPEAIEAIGERLEFRGADATFSRMRDAYFDELPLGSARTVLDVGCGTGVEARALLTRPDFVGRVVAVDQSPALLERARRLATEGGVAGAALVRVGPSRSSTATTPPGPGHTQTRFWPRRWTRASEAPSSPTRA